MSVLTTADNRVGIVRQSIESVLAQTFADFELLVVIDDAAGETERVLREYRDPRIRPIRAGGSLRVGEGRNLGAAAARGEYLAALDCGDLARPTRLARQVAFLESHPETVLLASGHHHFEFGEVRPGRASEPGPSWLIELLLLIRNPLVYSSIMARTAAIRQLGAFIRPERAHADAFDLYHRLLKLGRIARLDDRLVVCRRAARTTLDSDAEAARGDTRKVLADSYADWFGAGASELADMVVRATARSGAPPDRACLERFGSFLEELGETFSRSKALAPGERAHVRKALAREQSATLACHGPAAGRARLRAVRRLRTRAFGAAVRDRRPDRLYGHAYRRAALEDDRPPTLYVVVDTEAEFDWTQPFSRDQDRTSALSGLPRAQALFDRYGLRPTYLVDYPIAVRPAAAAVLREIHSRGGCEIGVHLHPWTTPPFTETLSARNSYPGNLPPDLEARKLEANARAVRDGFGIEPRFYKAGRYGIGPNTIGLLAEMGFTVDFSVMPATDFRYQEGPDLRSLRAVPYAVEGMGILSLPMTRDTTGLMARAGPVLSGFVRHPLLRALLARLHLYNIATLTPEGVRVAEQVRLLNAMLRRDHRVFVLHYHSPSLVAGHTEYVTTAAEEIEFLERLALVLDFFFNELGGLPGHPHDLLPPALRPIPARLTGERPFHALAAPASVMEPDREASS